MRLSPSEIKIIKSVACQVWGDQAHIYLFGSRVDDSKRGGDIDLYVDPKEDPEPREIMLKKAEFLARHEILLGEQKIDLLVKTSYNYHLPIIKTAELTGIELL
ncbi:MAG: nucleotidyltransferase domain-containing protein [Prolixibacteraceae bacterium]